MNMNNNISPKTENNLDTKFEMCQIRMEYYIFKEN